MKENSTPLNKNTQFPSNNAHKNLKGIKKAVTNAPIQTRKMEQ
jgi:hypothetical protein